MLSFISGLAMSCNHSDRRTTLGIEPHIGINSDFKDRLKHNKTTIDNLMKSKNSSHLMFAKLLNIDTFIRVINDTLPPDIETMIEMVKDSVGQLLIASEFSITESADWNILWTHYFDKQGKTFAFQRRVTFYNSGCTNGMAQETKTNYYDENFQLIHEDYKLVDEKNTELQKDSCKFIHDYKHEPLDSSGSSVMVLLYLLCKYQFNNNRTTGSSANRRTAWISPAIFSVTFRVPK